MPIHNKKEIILSIGLILIPVSILLITVIIVHIFNKKEKPAPESQNVEEVKTVVEETPKLNFDVKAKAVYVKDLNTGKVLYAKNENEVLPLASLTKIMTAVVAIKNADDNQLVQISNEDLATEGEYYLSSNEVFKLKDLIKITMSGSVNDTASAIAGVYNNKKSFIEEMNRTAKQIGLGNSYFKNPTGLDIQSIIPSAEGSAKDVATLLQYALINYPEIFDSTTISSVSIRSTDGIIHKIDNTNKITGEIPGLIASKTGYTDSAGGNLALIVDRGLNEPVAIVILGSTDSTTRFDDALKILENI